MVEIVFALLFFITFLLKCLSCFATGLRFLFGFFISLVFMKEFFSPPCILLRLL